MRKFLLAWLFVLSAPLGAADLKVVGDQLIISGKADDSILAQVRDAIAAHGASIRTVILRDLNAGGTTTDNLVRVADLFMERGWRTAVSGYCISGCSTLFLGGSARHFTSDRGAPQTYVTLSNTVWLQDSRSNYTRHKGGAALTRNHIRSEWVKQRTGGQIAEGTLALIYGNNDPEARHFLHFFDAHRLKRDGASVLLCTGKEKAAARWQECTKITDTDAYRSGIVTSPELLRSNDLSASAPAGSSARQ